MPRVANAAGRSASTLPFRATRFSSRLRFCFHFLAPSGVERRDALAGMELVVPCLTVRAQPSTLLLPLLYRVPHSQFIPGPKPPESSRYSYPFFLGVGASQHSKSGELCAA